MTTQEEIVQVAFTQLFNGQTNIITPVAVEYGRIHFLMYEISKGVDFNGNPLWGLTFIDERYMVARHDLSQAYDSKLGCEGRIKQLKRWTPSQMRAAIGTGL